MEEQAGVPSPVLLVVQKRLRAAKKKLTRIQELEALQASGKELNSEQVPTVKSKAGVLAIIEELQKVDEGLRDALKEEHAAAFARGVAYGEAQGLAQAEQATTDLRQQLDDLALSHNAALSVLVEQHQQALLDQKDQLEQEGLVAREEAGKIAGEAAIQDALELEMSSSHPLKQILVEPIKKLLSLLYFSQLFDVHHSPYLARGEVYACLQYDAQVERTEGQAALSELALWELAYFGRTLVDRMHNQMSHEQFITSAVDAAMAWVLEPEKVAIPSPPAPTPITVGELQKRVARVLASKFSQVPPTSGPPPDVATGMLPPPPPPLHSTVAPAAFPVAPPAFPVPPPPLPPVPVPAAHPDAAAPGNPVAPPLSSTFNPSAPAASSYPPIQLLPSFFKDGGDGDASAVPALGLAPGTSSLSNAQSRGPPAPTPTLPQAGAASNMVVPGMYVLSETGIPQLRSSAPTGPPPLQHTMKPGGQ